MIPLRDDIHTSLRPVVTVALIVACVVTFLFQVSLGEPNFERVIYILGSIPALLFTDARLPPELALVPPELTLVSSVFLHGGWMHLLGNMLYLWIFGDNVEDAMGHLRYGAFYLICGVAAALAHAVSDPTSEVPVVGASGAISGVLGAYLLLYPHARILVLLPMGPFSRLVRLPAFLVLGFWFVLQLLSSLLAGPQQGGVAWWAHSGGFLVGMLLIPFFKYSHVHLWHSAHGSRRWYRRL